MSERLLTRVALRNYKSIASCDIEPSQLTFLVGPNGAGKSNFLDALRFVTDALRFSLDHALRDRGGIDAVRRKSSGHPTNFGIRLDYQVARGRGYYAFEVGALKAGGFRIQREECAITNPTSDRTHYYRVKAGSIESSIASPPAAAADRLYLVNVSGTEEFRPVYDALSTMGFYNLNPNEIRELQPPDPGDLLKRDGSNIASVLARLSARSPNTKARILNYLEQIVPGIAEVETKTMGPKETLEFRQDVGAKHPWRLFASNMSDGTLRALGVLVALFQGIGAEPAAARFVGIEEPEAALHPAAAGILIDSLRDASTQIQVIVTSHSPDLLDNAELSADSVLAVVSEKGETRLGHLTEAAKSALRDHLFTAGELMRMDQLYPEPTFWEKDPGQRKLFDA